ncbi:MAG: UDP-N-acetylmuramate dehydrogenase [Candidatus Saccharimonadales bacterium]
MNIQENVDLSTHSTMRLGGKARYLSEVSSEEEVRELVEWAKAKPVPFLMVGDGSNIVWRDEGYPGLIIVNRLKGRKILIDDEEGATISIAGGENWDEVVAWTVEKGLSGVEFLSRIPGTVGASPVQNIGAYGSELADTLVEVEAFDTENMAFGGIAKEACGFGYRTSRFKGADKGRFLITGIVLKLSKSQPSPPFYESLQAYFDEHQVTNYNRDTVREAVTAIRAVKLPDPSVVNNNGSFFTNPIISTERFEKLKAQYPDIKGWSMPDGRVKVAAGWLIERAGFKGVHDQETGMATWPAQSLVLVNEHARRTADLLAFKHKIVDKVNELFDIVLEQEPELLP